MRIGIVGAGGAGLTAAWLLEEAHEVMLFEQEDRLGGHAQTVDVERDGVAMTIDAGFEFFSAAMFPTLLRLVRLLGVPLHPFPMTATFYTTDGRRTIVMPPIQGRRIAWATFAPRTLALLRQFQRALDRAPTRIDLDGGAFTLEEFLTIIDASDTLRHDLFYPLTLGGWCVDLAEFAGFSAYDVLRYFALNRPSGLTPTWWLEAKGGTRAYITALAGALRHTEIRRATRVMAVRRQENGTGGYGLVTGDGSVQEVDAVVLATNARDAAALLAAIPCMEARRRELERFEYFTTTIAVHGDRRLMPRRRRHWSVVNTRFDGAHSANTMWKRWNTGAQPVFKSWVTYEEHLPEPLYALHTYEHPRVTRSYFEAQQALDELQGQDNVWLAGMYTHDVDCHESAVVSAVRVARHLAPGTERLQALSGVTSARDQPARLRRLLQLARRGEQ